MAKRLAVPFLIVAIAGLVIALAFTRPDSSITTRSAPRSSLAAARAALRARDWERAAAAAETVLKTDPRDPAALLIAGEAAARLNRFPSAIGYYDAVPDSASSKAALARLCSGDLRLKQGRLTDAERDFRRAIELDPGQEQARSRLVAVLMLSGRRWEAGPHLMELVRHDAASLDALCSLGNSARLVTNDDELSRFRDLAPDDPLPVLGLAALAQVREGDEEHAELLLQKVIKEHPDLIEAQVRLGDLLAKRGDVVRFLSWHQPLPSNAERHPQLWHDRGMFAAAQGETETAARCFWEALRREPNHLAAAYQLSALLSRLNRPAEAQRLGERARKLQRVAALITDLHQRTKQIELIHELFDLLRELGRNWEARAWLQVAMIVDRDAAWIADEEAFFRSSSMWEPDQTVSISLPTAWLDCSSYPLPKWAAVSTIARQTSRLPSAPSQIRFDIANVGIDFGYFNSPDDSTPGVRMQEFTGGGIGVTDFDYDGRPDLYLTQGCNWPPDPEQRTHLDRLYRNVAHSFADVTERAGLVEPGFSQGIACGDFDSDGFDDLYVANIGTNRLFVNNGDGTFRDATRTARVDVGVLADAWTISAAMVDLNGDRLPDLFDVNYVEGERVYEMVCGDGAEQRACSPNSFEGQPDRLLLNRGDGTFEDVTPLARIDGPKGTGMGLVAADFDGTGRLSLFVANDIQNNHFYVNETPSQGGPPLFAEQAVLNGLAYDRDGRVQACMGVAAGDADNDGLLDLFVTNYVDESNTLYRQQGGGLFADETRAAGLSEPSFKMLGFGTQFLDADNDGWQDLVVANGHIDDFLHKGYEYRMRPQFFRNLGGKFAEAPADVLGPYFQKKLLGRGLARLDWNGDGREEFAVSHLGDPAALLTNVTSSAGRSLCLRLRATETARDAIGTIVTVEAGGRRLIRQLTAGDGYEASNERQLVFGMGEAEQADKVTVRWPSGRSQEFEQVTSGPTWLMMEGRERPYRLSR